LKIYLVHHIQNLTTLKFSLTPIYYSLHLPKFYKRLSKGFLFFQTFETTFTHPLIRFHGATSHNIKGELLEILLKWVEMNPNDFSHNTQITNDLIEFVKKEAQSHQIACNNLLQLIVCELISHNNFVQIFYLSFLSRKNKLQNFHILFLTQLTIKSIQKLIQINYGCQ
jgi:hypothetical protein